MQQLKAEFRFLRALIGVNLSSAMEYRASFLSQIVFMFINNGIYFIFWVILFDQFGDLQGYQLEDVYLLFALVAFGYGVGNMFAGNTGSSLAYTISQGRLDYYLVLPRRLLPHVIFSRMTVSTIGDVSFGLMAIWFAGLTRPSQFLLFFLCSIPTAAIYVGFATMAGSLAFFMGNSQYASQQLSNGILTFAMYPDVLFSGGVRFVLYTLVPAFFIGAVPVQIVRSEAWVLLAGLYGVALLVWLVASAVFAIGLRRYESGSAININV